MSRSCQICGRGTSIANNVSHSNVKTKRKQKINLQKKKINGIKVKICTSCLKTKTKSK